jgi:medium-chain acyl-[acyl-carrier-protein] hydrolase
VTATRPGDRAPGADAIDGRARGRDTEEMDPLLWFATPSSAPCRVRLFCLPYAGGGPSVYLPWAPLLSPGIELLSVNLPGRAARLAEPPIRRMPELVARLLPDTMARLDRPYALFGHSLGAHVAYELACVLRDHGAPSPQALVVSARRAPQLPERNTLPSRLDDAALLRMARTVYGLRDEIDQHPELVPVILPALRADFEIADSYSHVAGPPLACPVVALGGLDDDTVDPAELRAWRAVTTGSFEMRLLPGGHFFIHAHAAAVTTIVAAQLQRPA